MLVNRTWFLTPSRFSFVWGPVILLTLGFASMAQARMVIEILPGSQNLSRPSIAAEVIILDSMAQDGVAAGSSAIAQDTEAASFDPKAFRLQSLLQLQFDRRPSTILSAWATELAPPLESSDSALDEGEPAEAEPDRNPESDDAIGEAEQAVDEATAQAAAAAAAATAEAQRMSEEIQQEVAEFARWVTLGNWERIGEYLADLPDEQPTQVYDHLLKSLAAPPPGPGTSSSAHPSVQPQHVLTPDDVVGLADAAPEPLAKQQIEQLGNLLSQARSRGYVLNKISETLETGTRRLGGEDESRRKAAAQLFLIADSPDLAFPFLPAWPANDVLDDPIGLRLLARYFDTKYAQEATPALLGQSWNVHQALLVVEGLTADERSAVVQRAVELSTLVEQELGQEWLENSFSRDLERGVRILAELGGTASDQLIVSISNPTQRKSLLTLQNKAAETLVQVSAEQARNWQETLTLLAEYWVREAELAHTFSRDESGGLRMQWDRYGNFFYLDPNDPRFGHQQTGQAAPIPIRDVLDLQPSPAWIELVSEHLQPQIAMLLARLYLKINDEESAFPNIEQLAPDQPDAALELVHEFLRTWTRNHDPNNEQRRFNPYMYIYGYNQQAEAIPLTRSRQQRNLEKLSGWVARIRILPIGAVDESLLAQAFTTCHSSAEVFRVEAFTAVFGEIASLKPETVASLAHTMRGNLASVWRQVRVQEAYRTRRQERDVQQEVIRGYHVARQIVANARREHPDQWQLQLAEASLLFDENVYTQSIQPTTEFIERRDAAFTQFQKAADSYAATVDTLDKTRQSTDVFDYWFYAALGSTDLGQVSHEQVSDPRQFPLIARAIDQLPSEAADFHLGRFANNLFSRMGTVQPQVKYRYLNAGFEIVGDHPRAWEARRTFQYYNDVLGEAKLAAEIDGSDMVGHQQPFGVFVKLLHTSEMERESGGFDKYVQNQNVSPYAYNYGRPTENYRDRFQESVVKLLGEHFEVISVAFEDPKVMRSRPTERDGWRQTPYAYLLLRARGPQVDRLPPLQLHLDFVDTSGFVVLPIESPMIPLDATPAKVAARPFRDLEIVQTIDERQAKEGKLILEVRATARGLVPELEEILKLNFDDLEVIQQEDQGVIPSAFDADSDEIQVVSDRSWLLKLAAAPGQRLNQFQFCSPRIEDATVKLQRYDDADLVVADYMIRLDHTYSRRGWVTWWPAALLVLGGLAVALVAVVAIRSRQPELIKERFEMPEDINPFTVLGLLYQIDQHGRLGDAARRDLRGSIDELEQHYFGPTNGRPEPELESMARTWLARAKD